MQWEKRTGFSPRTVTRLLRMMFSGKKHILHAHDLGPLIYGSLTKCLTLGRVQLVVTLHTLLHLQKNRRYRFYFKTFLRFADRIVAVSPGVKAGLVELGIAPERIDIVPNGTTFAAALTRDPSTLAALKKKLMPGLAEDLYQSRWILYLARLQFRQRDRIRPSRSGARCRRRFAGRRCCFSWAWKPGAGLCRYAEARAIRSARPDARSGSS